MVLKHNEAAALEAGVATRGAFQARGVPKGKGVEALGSLDTN